MYSCKAINRLLYLKILYSQWCFDLSNHCFTYNTKRCNVLSYHHVQIIVVHPVLGVHPALVALIKLWLYHFDSICIDVPIGIVPIWTASRFIKQTLKHRFRWSKSCIVWLFIFQRDIYKWIGIHGSHICSKICIEHHCTFAHLVDYTYRMQNLNEV